MGEGIVIWLNIACTSLVRAARACLIQGGGYYHAQCSQLSAGLSCSNVRVAGVAALTLFGSCSRLTSLGAALFG